MAEHARRVDCVADLAAIYEPDAHLAFATRQPDPAVAAFTAAVIEARCLPAVSLVIGRAEAVAPALLRATGMTASRVAAWPGFTAWCADLELLVDIFTSLFDLDQAGLRITTLDGPMCPRFHVDHVPCRLITTYGGRGTEWLPEEHVDRTRLGHCDLPVTATSSGDAAVESIPPWAIALFRGEGWLDGSLGGVVHRSPHVTAAEPRLLVTVDFTA